MNILSLWKTLHRFTLWKQRPHSGHQIQSNVSRADKAQSVSGWFLPTFSFGDKLQVEDIHRCRSQTMLVKNYKARQEIKLNISRTFPILFSLLISCKNLNNSISPPNGKKSYIQKLFCNHYGKKIIFFICCMIFCSSYFTVLWKEMDWIKYSCACACMCNCTLLKTTIRGQVIDQKSSFVKKKKKERKKI